MARLIDADEMRENIEWCKSQSGQYNDIYWDDVIERLDAQPTVDAVPVKHGRWIKRGYACGENEYKCSVCGETEWRTNCERMKYCMFCGAKMDGGGADDHS